MEEYLNQGILEAQMEKMQRERYIRMLRQKLSLKPELHTCICLFKNLMINGDYVQAEEVLNMIDEKWHRRRSSGFEDTISGRAEKEEANCMRV